MSAWPGSLPQECLQQGFGEGTQDNRARTSMDTGPAKMRRRATAAVQVFDVGLLLTKEQAATLELFFDDVLEAGTGAFDWKHPRTGLPAEVRFVTRPAYSRRSGLYLTSFQVEVLP